MLRTIGWFIYFWLYLLTTYLFLLKYKLLGKFSTPEKQQAYLEKISTTWARRLVRAAGGKIEVVGAENLPQDRNVLFVSNHQGNFDIPTLIGFVPRFKGFVAKKEMEKMPMVSGWMKKLNCIFLDREDPRQALKTITEGIRLLKEGKNLVIFPEGTRSKGNEMAEFKKGSIKLATKAGVPVVPLTISGTYKLLEEKGNITPGNVKIYIHPAIYMEELSNDEKNNLHEIVQEIVASKL